jgi:hypothetical protein
MENSLVAGPYHPALKELVQSRMFLDRFTEDLSRRQKGDYTILVNPRQHSQTSGQKKANIKALAQLGYNVVIKQDNTINKDDYKILEGEKQCI